MSILKSDNSKTLYLFTTNYPFGTEENFIETEIEYLSKYFKSIIIIPYAFGNSPLMRKIPPNAKCESPLMIDFHRKYSRMVLGLLKNGLGFFYIKELLKNFKKIRGKIRGKWLSEIMAHELLLQHPVCKKLRNENNDNAVFYFYWGIGATRIVPFLKKSSFSKIVVRFHGYDLYEEDRNESYIPFREALLNNITDAIFISEDGQKYLKARYNNISFNTKIFRLGVHEGGFSSASQDNILRIVSCSHMRPVKRLHVLIDALKYITLPVIWTHIGAGLLYDDIKKMASALPSNIKVNFLGSVRNDGVYEYYKSYPVDLFINVSESEGVPVSIMEALSFGIPVFATAAGGTSEIIDVTVGKLLPIDVSVQLLSTEIVNFYNLSLEQKIILRNSAKKKWRDMCDAETNYTNFAKYLSK